MRRISDFAHCTNIETYEQVQSCYRLTSLLTCNCCLFHLRCIFFIFTVNFSSVSTWFKAERTVSSLSCIPHIAAGEKKGEFPLSIMNCTIRSKLAFFELDFTCFQIYDSIILSLYILYKEEIFYFIEQF